MAGTAVAAGCGGTYGGPAPISDFPQKSLTVSHFSGGPRSGLTATLNFDDLSWCDVLESDAFARLDGRPVPLFPGQVKVIPPQGDDGSVECLHPSVTLADFPSDLPPPWTIEIGDSSETLSATFAAAPFAPVTLSDPVLTSAALTLKLQRQPGDETAITGQATLTASDGQSTTRVAQAGDAEIAFSTFTALWPAGPVAVAVTLDFFSPDELLDCQAPKCTVTQGSGVQGPPATATFTVQLVTPTD